MADGDELDDLVLRCPKCKNPTSVQRIMGEYYLLACGDSPHVNEISFP